MYSTFRSLIKEKRNCGLQGARLAYKYGFPIAYIRLSGCYTMCVNCYVHTHNYELLIKTNINERLIFHTGTCTCSAVEKVKR